MNEFLTLVTSDDSGAERPVTSLSSLSAYAAGLAQRRHGIVDAQPERPLYRDRLLERASRIVTRELLGIEPRPTEEVSVVDEGDNFERMIGLIAEGITQPGQGPASPNAAAGAAESGASLLRLPESPGPSDLPPSAA